MSLSLSLRSALSVIPSHSLPSSSSSFRISTYNLFPARLFPPRNPSSCGGKGEDLCTRSFFSSVSAAISPGSDGKTEILKLHEVESVLKKVKADDVRVIPVGHSCSWADYMVFATGRSTWHVKNIAQAILYEAEKDGSGDNDGISAGGATTIVTQAPPSYSILAAASHLIKLRSDNYHTWRSLILPFLRGNNLFRFIDGSHPCPTAIDTEKEQSDRLKWQTQDQLAKEKQRGVKRMVLPSVEGQEGGKWIVIDSGTIMIHAFDEKARAYYNLENHWLSQKSAPESSQDLAKAMVKIRRRNNSKKKFQGAA